MGLCLYICLIWVASSGPLLFHDHLGSVFLNLTNLLIFDNIFRWPHMKLMLQIRFPLSISFLLLLLSISCRQMKIDGTRHWKNWIDGTRRRQDLNPQPPDLILDELDHRRMVRCLLSFYLCYGNINRSLAKQMMRLELKYKFVNFVNKCSYFY